MRCTLESRNVIASNRRTSIRLEREIWNALDEMCEREEISVNQVCTALDRVRGNAGRTSAVRTLVVAYFRIAAAQGNRRRGSLRVPGNKSAAKRADRRAASQSSQQELDQIFASGGLLGSAFENFAAPL